jgi:mono/diheme cytochrome c family protein
VSARGGRGGPVRAAALAAAAACTALAVAVGVAAGSGDARAAPSRGAASATSPASPASSEAHWATQFLLHCSGCHGANGAGVGSVPDLRGNLGHFLATPEGRRFVLQVPGVANARMSDADLAQLTNWMVRRFAPETMPKDFRPYDADEVRAARGAVPADVTGERRRVVAALRERGLDVR